MKLAWATDIHLDFCSPSVRGAFYDQILHARADALLLTGDIADAWTLEPMLLELADAVGIPVYFVLGNHDFYGSSVAEVREKARALTDKDERLRWLPAAGIVTLTENTALVGHDGWADGRFGDWRRSRVLLNDYGEIRDLAPANFVLADLLPRIQALAAEAADHFAEILPCTLAAYKRVIIGTHVPPFREACWHEGRISDDQWLPHFSSKVAGDAILQAVRDEPGSDVTVLCGHTHSSGTAQMLPNLSVRTGGAVYGRPQLQAVIEL